MEILGHVQNGLVVPDTASLLPEGAVVSILYPVVNASATEFIASRDSLRENRRVEFPLVRTGEPGSLPLTNDLVAEILNADDVASAGR